MKTAAIAVLFLALTACTTADDAADPTGPTLQGAPTAGLDDSALSAPDAAQIPACADACDGAGWHCDGAGECACDVASVLVPCLADCADVCGETGWTCTAGICSCQTCSVTIECDDGP